MPASPYPPIARLAAAARLLRRPADAWLLVAAQRALLAARLELWTRPVGHLVTEDVVRLAPAADVPRARRHDPVARRLAVAVQRASRHGVFRPTCLVRAVALHRLLARHGVAGSHVRVGVRRPRGTFEAHAWVELDGLPLDETPDVGHRYARLEGVHVP